MNLKQTEIVRPEKSKKPETVTIKKPEIVTTKKPEVMTTKKPETSKVKFLSAKRRGKHYMTFDCKYRANESTKVSWFLNDVSVEENPRFKVTEKYKKNKNVLISTLKVVS